jgi:hypothetical protein
MTVKKCNACGKEFGAEGYKVGGLLACSGECKDKLKKEQKATEGPLVGCLGAMIIAIGLAMYFMFFPIRCSSSPSGDSAAPPPTASQNWYEGGSLHKSTDSEWLAATPENRLATSSDFVAAAKDRFQFNNMDELKMFSIQMNSCITEAAQAKSGQTAASLAATCALLIKK